MSSPPQVRNTHSSQAIKQSPTQATLPLQTLNFIDASPQTQAQSRPQL
ncbi:hypothetical protein [Rubritalea tangerina]